MGKRGLRRDASPERGRVRHGRSGDGRSFWGGVPPPARVQLALSCLLASREMPFPSTEWRQRPSARRLRGTPPPGALGRSSGISQVNQSHFTVTKHGILATTARLHGRKNVPGSPRQRRPLPSCSHVAVWPHTRTTPARCAGNRRPHTEPVPAATESQGATRATAAPSGGGGGETKGPGATSWGGAMGRAQQPPAQMHTTPRLGRKRHRLTTWPRGAPFLCPLKARSLGTRTHDGHRTTCTTDPSRTEGPDWLHRTVDLAKKTTP